jgi:pyruvate/2-oxoglutarate dehydrogenase complex dihydrolipoamide dehydrogenase (E3) component
LLDSQLLRDGVVMMFAPDLWRVIIEKGERLIKVRETPPGWAPGGVAVDAILVATGRVPNVESLGLEAARVHFDTKNGVHVNDHLQTTNPRVFAAGDVCSGFKFTHAADALARIAVQNALFYGRAKASALVIPWCTYTDPEIAHVGLSERDAQTAGVAIQTFVQEFRHIDRALLDGDADGFAKFHVRKGSDQIVGATIVSRHAGDMIGEVALAMTGKLGLKTLAKTIHPYPTHAEALKKLGDAYNKTRLTPTVRWLFAKWFGWT